MAKPDIRVADFRVASHYLAGHARLVVTDPPYNQGVAYGWSSDSRKKGDFVDFLMDLADASHRVLAPGGTAVVVISERWQAEAFAAFASFDAFEFRRSIVWNYTFGQNQGTRNFTPAWAMLHVFGRKPSSGFTFNHGPVMVKSARQLKYNDKRANPAGKVMDNIWTISRVCGTFKEKVKYPNQLPLALTDRLVQVYSSPGDTVIDLCCGSGTVLVSAVKHGRNAVGCDISPQAVAIARNRISAVDAGDAAG